MSKYTTVLPKVAKAKCVEPHEDVRVLATLPEFEALAKDLRDLSRRGAE